MIEKRSPRLSVIHSFIGGLSSECFDAEQTFFGEEKVQWNLPSVTIILLHTKIFNFQWFSIKTSFYPTQELPRRSNKHQELQLYLRFVICYAKSFWDQDFYAQNAQICNKGSLAIKQHKSTFFHWVFGILSLVFKMMYLKFGKVFLVFFPFAVHPPYFSILDFSGDFSGSLL